MSVFANIHADWFEGSFSLICLIRHNCGFFVYRNIICFLRFFWFYHDHIQYKLLPYKDSGLLSPLSVTNVTNDEVLSGME